jgi:hypothetical protein
MEFIWGGEDAEHEIHGQWHFLATFEQVQVELIDWRFVEEIRAQMASSSVTTINGSGDGINVGLLDEDPDGWHEGLELGYVVGNLVGDWHSFWFFCVRKKVDRVLIRQILGG